MRGLTDIAKRIEDTTLILLDMKTIFIILVVGHIFTVVLISSYWRDHKGDNTLNTFFYAKCVQAIAWSLLTVRGGIRRAQVSNMECIQSP